jgi:cyclopropane-fatty-acyl-phospholipid synthase
MLRLRKSLELLIKIGRLTVITPDGAKMRFGAVSTDEPQLDVVVRLKGALTPLKLAINPDLYLGEAYMDGMLVIEHGSLWDLLDICGRNLRLPRTRSSRLVRAGKAALRGIQQYNPARVARRNVAHHYDLSHSLYRNFLDDDLQYSCGYFPEPGLSLDDAQAAKKDHIAAKLLLKPGQRVLDIGCGWGGLALSLAQMEKIDVVGATLSCEQFVIAQQRARAAGLEPRVQFELRDFRKIRGKFDRIVSVGMFEHVGTPHYSEFFEAILRLLTDDGIALIHSIGRMKGPDVTTAWIRKYIFPGGYIPALSQVLPAVERAGLWITDLEILRLHYAQTLRRWRERFLENRDQLRRIYDERFCRMWEFYLAVSEMSFRHGGLMVFQMQLARQIDAAPLTRDYMFEGRQLHRELMAAE